MPAPTVTTSAATGITPSKATLNGTVDPNGLSTDYWFERWRDDWQAAEEPSRTNVCKDPLSTHPLGAWVNSSPLWTAQGKEFSVITAEEAGFGAEFVGEHALRLVYSTKALCRVGGAFRIPCTAGVPITYSAYIRKDAAGSHEARLQGIFYNAAGESLGPFPTKNVIYGPGETIRISTTGTPPAGAVSAEVQLNTQMTGAEGNVSYITRWLVEESATLGSYFPRPHELASGQAVWTGAELESPSALATPTNAPESKEGDAGKGEEAIAVSEKIAGLSAEKVYHARLYATNADGEAWGEDKTFTTLAAPKRKLRRKPPVGLDVEVETPGGNFTLPCDAKRASQRPRNLSGSTLRGDGFGTGSASFSRAIFKQHPDIGLLDTWRMVSKSGDVAYEGRLHSAPRTNDPQEQIDVALVGWMTYLKSRKITPLIIDRRFSGWGEGSLARRATVLGASGTYAHYSASSDFDGIKFDGESGSSIPSLARAELVYDAGDHNAITKAMYKGLQQNTGNVEAAVLFTDDNDALSTKAEKALTLDNTLRTAEPTTPEQYAMLRALASATHTPEAQKPFSRTYEFMALYGNTGLTTRSVSEEPDAVWLSDILEYIIRTFYPKITWAGQTNTFPLTQATWHDNPSFGYDIVQQLNGLVLWETNVWEGRKFYFEPADLTTYDWMIRTDDPGVTVVFQGDSIENFANGISVTYTDFAGVKRIIYPDENSELLDESENNPATVHGENLWTDTEVPWPCVEAEAVQFGRAYLAEFNRPKRPGTYSIAGGYIKDAAGNWHPGWKPRCSETIGIMDSPVDEPRLVTATEWNDEAKTLQVTVDAPSSLLDAVVARQELALQARNLA